MDPHLDLGGVKKSGGRLKLILKQFVNDLPLFSRDVAYHQAKFRNLLLVGHEWTLIGS